MDNNNRRSTQGGESANDGGGDWRSQMQEDESRKRIFNHIMNKLKRRFPLPGQEGFQELRKISMRFEEKIYTSATSRVDYFKKISANMQAMETKYPISNAISSNFANIGQNPQDPGSQSMQFQSGQLLLQNIGTNIAAAGMQGSSQTNIPSVNRSFNTQSIPPISGVLQNSVPSAIGQGIPPYNVFAYSQRQTGRQQQGVSNIRHHMLLPTQQQQHLVGQSTATNIQQNQIIGQQNRIPDMQQNQQRLPSQQNKLSNQQSQQLMGLPNNFAHMYQQQLGTQEQQQHHQFVGAHQSASNLLPNQAQQSHQQVMSNQFPNQTQTQQQSQMMFQVQPVQFPQQLGLQLQPNLLHRGMQQTLQTLQQKQVFQPQRAMEEALSTSLDSTSQTGNADGRDWQEETFRKIKTMKDMHFPDLIEIYQKVVAKMHQRESLLLQQPQLQQRMYPKLKAFKSMLERFISLLQISKSNLQIGYKDNLGIYEEQIMRIINLYRLSKPIPRIGSGGTVQQNVSNLQHNPSSAKYGISLHPSSSLGPGQINSMNSVQIVATGSLQKNPVSVPQQATVNLISSQSGMTSLKANYNSMQPSLSMLQQQQDQLQQNQNLKEFQHYQMQQNLLIAPSKASTPVQPVYSPVVLSSPSTPVVPSHMLGDLDSTVTSTSKKPRIENGGGSFSSK